MRTLVLVLLWLGVAGFGLMTLCSGVFVFTVPVIAVPFGLIVAFLAAACGRRIWRMRREAEASAQPPGQ